MIATLNFTNIDRIASYTYRRSLLVTTGQHDDDELCANCETEMGPYCPVNSIRYTCCEDRWSHVTSLKKLAYEKGGTLCCPSCSSYNEFRANLLACGVFVSGRHILCFRTLECVQQTMHSHIYARFIIFFVELQKNFR